MIRYGSVCSGIEAATTAWHGLGWQPVFFSEIEPFPCSVLAHHWPSVPNLGDLTKHESWNHEPIDLLVGGTPCQAFSVAGLREGLADPRGNLTLTFLALVERTRPRWVVWENVPGVLSDSTNAFGQFLSGLAELGYGWAYRVLDAQYFGVAQRRRRVFVVASAGADWRRAAAVLFEPDCLRGNPPPSRQAGERPAGTISSRTSGGGGLGTDFELGGGLQPCKVNGCWWDGGQVSQTLDAVLQKGQAMPEKNRFPAVLVPGGSESYLPTNALNANAAANRGADNATNTTPTTPVRVRTRTTSTTTPSDVAHSLRGEGFDASEDGTGRGTPLVPVAFNAKDHGADAMEDMTPTLRAGTHDKSHANSGNWMAVAFAQNQVGEIRTGDILNTLNTNSNASGRNTPLVMHPPAVVYGIDEEQNAAAELMGTLKARMLGGGFESSVMTGNMRVRRLTPRECERLQGFPDDHTLVPHRGKPAADGPRYKAIGNSMAVPVMKWIGQRIQNLEET